MVCIPSQYCLAYSCIPSQYCLAYSCIPSGYCLAYSCIPSGYYLAYSCIPSQYYLAYSCIPFGCYLVYSCILCYIQSCILRTVTVLDTNVTILVHSCRPSGYSGAVGEAVVLLHISQVSELGDECHSLRNESLCYFPFSQLSAPTFKDTPVCASFTHTVFEQYSSYICCFIPE